MTSEADFAVTVREWDRAEGLYASAAKLCPDTGAIWINLGAVRMRQGNREGARDAYKSALADYVDDSGRDPADTEASIRRAYVLVLLSRLDDARAVIDKARAKNPDDMRLRGFVGNHELDAMVADPAVKSLTP